MNEKNKLISSFLIKNTPDKQSLLSENSDLKLDAHRARFDEIKNCKLYLVEIKKLIGII